MKNLILIDDNREYTLSEFAHSAKRALSAIAAQAPSDLPVSYPGREVYFCIIDLLSWINDRVPGEFRIAQTKSKHYQIIYYEKAEEEEKAQAELNRNAAKTALEIENMTGQLPAYANKPAIAEIVDKLRNGSVPSMPEEGTND